MKRARLLLLPIAAVLEVALLAVCWAVVLFAPNAITPIKDWAMKVLPSMDWYRQR